MFEKIGSSSSGIATDMNVHPTTNSGKIRWMNQCTPQDNSRKFRNVPCFSGHSDCVVGHESAEFGSGISSSVPTSV